MVSSLFRWKFKIVIFLMHVVSGFGAHERVLFSLRCLITGSSNNITHEVFK